jgi:hypothetical protein
MSEELVCSLRAKGNDIDRIESYAAIPVDRLPVQREERIKVDEKVESDCAEGTNDRITNSTEQARDAAWKRGVFEASLLGEALVGSEASLLGEAFVDDSSV